MAVNNRVKITNDIELKDSLVATNRVTKVTKSGRTFSSSAIVVVGNEDGIIGWGLGKAGRTRWMGRRPRNRGVVMNPVDHPMGGGEGRASGGHPRSRTGLYACLLYTSSRKQRKF